MRGAFLLKLPDITNCADVTDSGLTGISGEIIILDQGALTLQDGDFRWPVQPGNSVT